MKKYILFLLPFLLALNACKYSSEKKLMKDYFANQNDNTHKLIKIESVEQVLAIDSFNILTNLFTAKKDTLIMYLQRGLEYATTAYNQAKEGYDNTEFPVLKPSFKETMDRAQIQMEKAQNLIKSLNSDCKETDLEKDYLITEHYKLMGQELLGYKLICQVRNEETDVTKTYFLDKTKKKVVFRNRAE